MTAKSLPATVVRVLGVLGLVLASLPFAWNTPASLAQAVDPCLAPANAIVAENCLPGNPASEWDISGMGAAWLQGFTTDISVNRGQTVNFKIDAAFSGITYHLDIYRLGYYQGLGARKVATIAGISPTDQPACLTDPATGLIDCGNWTVSASWTVPANAVSGIYFAKAVTDEANPDSSHIFFIVRNDSSTSDILFQTTDTTWQAYNQYGGNSLYVGGPGVNPGRAYKVSYNRPITTRATNPEDWVFNAEYPMVRWLERNGYDVSYFSGIDTHRFGNLLLNHNMLLYTGHDEYWSGQQRANVEAARNAGVHLAFFTANEIYWRTRYENSLDGSQTPLRTLVVYKETRADAKIDPAPEWTGTWRDPRPFNPMGANPENALVGNMYFVNCCTYAIQVPSDDGKLRFWRNTSVATLGSGDYAILAANTLGYEWNEAPDNGFQPAGLIKLSTTTQNVPEYLIDYGSTVAPRTATHNLTLYRHASGALVFGAGTVQWAWGLDGNHDRGASTEDARMQQATVNLLADMNVQPGSLQNNLVAATASTDITPPTSTISSPAAGASVEVNKAFTIIGTASDVGGLIGGVEVSLDNGATWHPATGRSSWRYTFTPAVTGTLTLKSRAVDDSGRLETPGPGRTINVQDAVQQVCPCSIWTDLIVPAQPSITDGQALEVGVKFRSDVNGYVTGVRFYKGTTNVGTHTGHLWTSTGTLLGTATFVNETASGWQTVYFDAPIAIVSNTTYIASYHSAAGYFAYDAGYFNLPVDSAPLHALANNFDGANGVYVYSASSAFPSQPGNGANYWIDVIFNTTAAPDTTAPIVSLTSPASEATGVLVTSKVTATFNEPMDAGTLTAAQFELRDPANALVGGSVGYDPVQRTVSLTPTVALAYSTRYTATLTTGVRDVAGNALAANVVWSFTTSAPPPPPQNCPCAIWPSEPTPTQPAVNDGVPIEVGVKFRSDVAGYITGVKFYKGAANTGTHIGTLWTSSGTPLASATFSNETAAGWQTVTFAAPVPIDANVTYVASYYSAGGYFAYEAGYFAAGVDNVPLHALAAGVDGVNGVYRYGSAGFPTSGSHHNYWVDVVFAPTAAVDNTPPTVTGVSPQANATSVSSGINLSANFSEGLQAATVNAATFELRDAANAVVPAVVTYNTGTATLNPNAPLALAATYTATLKTGITDLAGNALAADYVWSFNTMVPQTCPCSIYNGLAATPAFDAITDGTPIEVGVKFRTDTPGYVTGLKFYKGAANTGTHVGHLWDANGTLLASATFANESATGWQSVTFNVPVNIAANTTYIASYHSATGYFAYTANDFAQGVDNPPLYALGSGVDGVNGVYRYGASGFPSDGSSNNYWVDVIFETDAAPMVVNTAPANGDTDVDPQPVITVSFNEAMQTASITAATLEVRDANGVINATVNYDSNTHTASLSPIGSLSPMALYTVTVKGGSSGVRDAAGQALITDYVFAFRPGARQTCPCTLFTGLPSTPAFEAVTDGQAIEVGVKFRSDVGGTVRALRFYKGAANIGTHTGHLWDANGTLLATVDFTSESSSGWQEAALSVPVRLNAHQTYIASYYSASGYFAFDPNYFAVGVDNRPLHAPVAGAGTPNGVYTYGNGFTATGSNANYWVDVVFDADQPPVAAHQAVATAANVPLNITLSATDANNDPLSYAIVDAPTLGTLSGVAPHLSYTPQSQVTGVDTFTFKANDGTADSNTATITVTINAPVPTVSAVGPNSAVAGDPALTLIVTGTQFVNGAVVRWNGADRATTFISSTRLTAALSAADLAAAASVSVTVFNPAPGGGVSNAVSFTVAANRIVNGRFELDANGDSRPDSWTSSANFLRSTAVVRSGTYAGRHFSTANASYTLVQAITGVTAGTTYEFSAYTNIPATADAFTYRLRVQWRNAAGTQLRLDTVKTYTASTGGNWDRALANLVAPANSASVVIRMEVTSLNATLYADDFTLRTLP